MNLFDLSAVLKLDTSQYENGIASARQSAQGFVNSTDNMNGALGKAQKGFTVFKGVLSNVATKGVGMLASAISSNLGGAISRVDTINNYSTVMRNLGHGAEESQKAIDQLVEGIDGLPTTLDGIVTVQQQFAALGGKMEDATALTIALNNATLAGGQGQAKANGAMQQWYQMIAAGKSDMMSMRIINEAMPAQMDAIAKAVMGADANWQDLHAEWQKNPEITQKVKDAILELNEEGINGTAGFAQQAEDATKGIQTSMQNLQTAIKNGVGNIINEIGTDKIAGVFASLKEGVKNAFGNIVEFMQNAKKIGIADAVQQEIDNFTNILDNLPSIVEDVMNQARESFNNFASNVDFAGMVDQVIQSLYTSLPKIIESLASFFSDTMAPWLAENGADIIVSLAKGVINGLPIIISAMGHVVNGILKVVIGLPAKLLAKGLMAVGKFALGLLKGVNKVTTAAGKWVSGVIKGLAGLAGKVAVEAYKAIYSFVGKLQSGVGQVVSAASRIVTGVVTTIRNGFSAIGDVGMNLVRGIWNGISAGYGWITGQIRSWVGNVKDFIKALFGISSPSKWARDVIGFNIDKGLALGIEQNAGLVDDAFEDVMPDVSTMSLMSEHAPTSNKTSFSYPVFNNEIVVNGAEDPESWADKFMNRLQMEARMA